MERMGYLGPQGTHSEAAALYLAASAPEHYKLVAQPDIYTAMQAVLEDKIDCCLVPVENSLEGSINITLDMLAHSEGLAIARELVWPVHNQLMARCTAPAVKQIFSHGQPLSQCRTYLQEHYPQAEQIATASTAAAAKLVAESRPEEGLAAICTKRAGELYGLRPLASEIQDNMANCTRFYQVRKEGRHEVEPQREKGTAKMLVICQIDGQRAGSLCGVLQEFASRDVNMLRIESRPARTRLGAYIFFFDLAAAAPAGSLMAAIDAVRQKSLWLKALGPFEVSQAVN
jgi:prephenate dehydratase